VPINGRLTFSSRGILELSGARIFGFWSILNRSLLHAGLLHPTARSFRIVGVYGYAGNRTHAVCIRDMKEYNMEGKNIALPLVTNIGLCEAYWACCRSLPKTWPVWNMVMYALSGEFLARPTLEFFSGFV
jgi:hypothetical protein